MRQDTSLGSPHIRALPGVVRHPLNEQVVSLLREAILSGQFLTGARLTETELSVGLGTSRVPVRDALNRLAGEGLVSNTRNGWQVMELDEDTISELYEVRLALESLAVRRASERIRPQDGNRLRVTLEAMRTALATADIDAYGRHDIELHQIIWQCAENRFVERQLSLLGPLVALLAARFANAQVLRLHEELVESVIAGDAQHARQVMERHMAMSMEGCLLAVAERRRSDVLD